MKHRAARNIFANAALLAAVVSVSSLAQPGRRLESPANRSLVTIVRVKPEMLDEWLDLQTSVVVPAMKKAGVKTRTVYTSGIFGRAFEYTIVQPLNRFADFDSAEGQAEALGSVADARLSEKLRNCVVSTSSFLSTALPDLSNPGENKSPSLVQLLRLRVGNMDAYENLYRSDVLPALKRVNSYVLVASRRLGTDGSDLTFETPMSKFSDLDAPPPLLRALGPEEAGKLMAKFNGLATVVENTILIRQGNLSF